jgi:GAF domain-containing protein
MPEARLKTEAGQSQTLQTTATGQQISALLATTVEQICSTMSASGAVIAVRDPVGACCLASAGDAPAVGSRLQADSAFTRECFETGEVVLCDDAENDSRILPSVAKSLHLRSAVAVPIQMQACVFGVIEVFSSRPSDIQPAAVDMLKECANLVAPLIAPWAVPGPQSVLKVASATGSGTADFLDLKSDREDEPSVCSSWFSGERTQRER